MGERILDLRHAERDEQDGGTDHGATAEAIGREKGAQQPQFLHHGRQEDGRHPLSEPCYSTASQPLLERVRRQDPEPEIPG